MCGLVCALTLLLPTTTQGQQPLGNADIRILGLHLEVVLPPGVPVPEVPRNTAYQLPTRLMRADADVSAEFPQYRVRAVVRGPGLATDGEEIAARVGSPLELGSDTSRDGCADLSRGCNDSGTVPSPPLRWTGNYVVDDIRLIDADGATLGQADPASISIHVPEQITVSDLYTRPLSMDEIRDHGILLDGDSFTAYEFRFAIATNSTPVPISLDVAFKQDDSISEPGSNSGLGSFGAGPGLGKAEFDVAPFILSRPNDGEVGKIPPIPGVIVIPGNVAYLNQYFQVMLLLSNVTPPSGKLTITKASAKLELPLGANGVREFANPSGDDPLWPAATAGGRIGSGLCDLASDNPLALTAEDPALCANVQRSTPPASTDHPASELAPSEQGRAEFLVQGRKLGSYSIVVQIEALLDLGNGQPPVVLHGTARGNVLVRHPSLSLTFNQPDVVQAGETYSLRVTVQNSSTTTPANLVTLSLDPLQVSGATLVGAKLADGTHVGASDAKTVAIDTIPPMDARTIELELVARKTGKVTSAAVIDRGAANGT